MNIPISAGQPEMGEPALSSSGPIPTPTNKEIAAAYKAFVARTGEIGITIPQQRIMDAMLDALVAAARVRAGLE